MASISFLNKKWSSENSLFSIIKKIFFAATISYAVCLFAFLFAFEAGNRLCLIGFIVCFMVSGYNFTGFFDFLSGIAIKVYGHYKKGDFVIIGDIDYPLHVENITSRVTIFKSDKGQIFILPNKEILQSKVFNFSQIKERHIVHAQYVFEKLKNSDKIMEIIKVELKKMPRIRQWPKFKIEKNYSNEGICLIDTWVWCNSDDFLEVENFMNIYIKQILRSNNNEVF